VKITIKAHKLKDEKEKKLAVAVVVAAAVAATAAAVVMSEGKYKNQQKQNKLGNSRRKHRSCGITLQMFCAIPSVQVIRKNFQSCLNSTTTFLLSCFSCVTS
jgi:hypothetical protein